MYFLLSPAKNLNESHEFTPKFYSTPPLLNHAARTLAAPMAATRKHPRQRLLTQTDTPRAYHRNTVFRLPFRVD